MTNTIPAESPDTDATRRCAYCGDEYSYQRSANRPPKYCTRVWPESPSSCQARAKAQRVAQKAVGLDGSVAAYRQAGEQVIPAISGLQETLAQLLEESRKVEAAALVRMADAERETHDAMDRVETADSAREAAERARADAERVAAAARHAAHEAERLAQQAEQERDAKVRQAWELVTRKEGERAGAVARAEEQSAAAARVEELRKAAHERAESLATANEELQELLTDTRAETDRRVAKAHTDAATARDDLVRAQADHVRQLDRVRDRAAAEVTQLRAERDAAQQTVTELRTEVAAAERRAEALSQQLYDAKATAQATAQRAEIADRRYEQLVAALSLRDDVARAEGAGPVTS
ncbi:MAG: hypothetical protein ACRDUA_00680 [Micromonosporaceae bacterium]